MITNHTEAFIEKKCEHENCRFKDTVASVCIGYITRWRSLCDLHTEGRRPEVV